MCDVARWPSQSNLRMHELFQLVMASTRVCLHWPIAPRPQESQELMIWCRWSEELDTNAGIEIFSLNALKILTLEKRTDPIPIVCEFPLHSGYHFNRNGIFVVYFHPVGCLFVFWRTLSACCSGVVASVVDPFAHHVATSHLLVFF
jgi:hypothetical protein